MHITHITHTHDYVPTYQRIHKHNRDRTVNGQIGIILL